jgi:hypothetical protein
LSVSAKLGLHSATTRARDVKSCTAGARAIFLGLPTLFLSLTAVYISLLPPPSLARSPLFPLRHSRCSPLLSSSLLRVPLVGLLATFAFVKSQQPNQRGWLPSKAIAKSSFCVVQTCSLFVWLVADGWC